MAFQRPGRPLKAQAIRPEDRVQDLERLHKLEHYLPPVQHTEQLVRAYFAQNFADNLRDALGDPAAIFALAQEYGPSVPPIFFAPQQITQQLSRASRPDAEVVEQEAKHARQEYVRHWVDCALLAWKLAGNHPVELDGELLPRPFCDDWAEGRSAAVEYLIHSVALTKDGLAQTAEKFTGNLRERVTQAGHVELPRQLVLSRRGGAFRFEAANSRAL